MDDIEKKARLIEVKRNRSKLDMKDLLDGDEATEFASQCSDWIVRNLGMDYPWPGNVRELEQCLRNLLIRGDYVPMASGNGGPPYDPDAAFFERCDMTAEELMRRYVAALHRRHGSVLATAKASGLDRRTVKKYLQ